MKYYIMRIEHKGYAAWWKHNNRGYDTNLKQARKFRETEVSTMHSILHGNKTAWPVDYIDSFGTKQIPVKMLANSMCWKRD